MRYLETIKENGPESVVFVMQKANEELAKDLMEVVNKWGGNGDMPILLAGIRKLIPALEKTAGEDACCLADMIQGQMVMEAIMISVPWNE